MWSGTCKFILFMLREMLHIKKENVFLVGCWNMKKWKNENSSGWWRSEFIHMRVNIFHNPAEWKGWGWGCNLWFKYIFLFYRIILALRKNHFGNLFDKKHSSHCGLSLSQRILSNSNYGFVVNLLNCSIYPPIYSNIRIRKMPLFSYHLQKIYLIGFSIFKYFMI